ncbi:MAG: DUF1330 domain-containing protein [Paracoccus sp. (in: a-proteobacteria)]|nr:DUF1330 domain-containing protein [Paracoccus sp. (in: a-proteobacteria)]
MIEFANPHDARARYHSPEYQAATALRVPVSMADLVIVEGRVG